MSKANGKSKDLAARVKAALTPRLRRASTSSAQPAGPFALCIAYDPKTGGYGFSVVTANPGLLDVADLYAALDAGRKHVMGMEQQAALRQAQERQAQEQPTVPPPGTAGQLAEAVGADDSAPHP